MDRINHATAIDIGGGRRGFRSKDTVAGVPGTVVAAAYLNGLQEELIGLIEKSGLVPDGADLTQLIQVLRRQSLNYRAAGGTANALTVTLDPAPASIAALNGMPLRLAIATTNTGASTININGLGAIPIVRPTGAGLAAGDLVGGRIADCLVVGNTVQLVGLTQARPGAVFAYGTVGTTNFIVPSGCYSARYKLWAGGGAGGGSYGTGAAGAGGASGAYCEGTLPVNPGDTMPITIGAPGAGAVTGPGGGGDGGTGGSSGIAGLVTAMGGTGGGAAVNAITSVQGVGGASVGASRDLVVDGIPGGLGVDLDGTRRLGGFGAPSFGGAPVGPNQGNAGIGGSFPGGGGSGAASPSGAKGGDGGRGFCIIQCF